MSQNQKRIENRSWPTSLYRTHVKIKCDCPDLLDLYVANNGLTGNGPNRLFQNGGGPMFMFNEVGAFAQVDANAGSTGVAWGDYDNDGDLDLYVAKHGSPNCLYENLGNGMFVEVGAAAGVDDPRGSNGVAWGDYDGDGDLDLYVANDTTVTSNNRLYRNNGNKTFDDVGPPGGVDGDGSSTGAAWGDYDNDGDLDLRYE